MGIVDILLWLYLDKKRIQEFGLKERLLCIVAWPWGLYVLIKNFMDVHNK